MRVNIIWYIYLLNTLIDVQQIKYWGTLNMLQYIKKVMGSPSSGHGPCGPV